MSKTFKPHRILHSMLRVTDLKRSLDFYTGLLGMTLLRRQDYEDGRFTLAFLGYGSESENTVVELTHNWDTDTYHKGKAYGHLALAVQDIHAFCSAVEAFGARITRPPGPMAFDATEVIAFIEDPDGYQIELIERS